MMLYIVRHGETIENKQMILQGHLPGNLTENGKNQIINTAKHLQETNVQFDCIISSDLKRAIESAEIISQKFSLPIIPMALLRERNWGPHTGMTITEAAQKFKKNDKWCFPQKGDSYAFNAEEIINGNRYGKFAETDIEIYDRAQKALKEIKANYSFENIIIVTHGQFARNMIAAHFNCSYHEISPIINGEIRKLSI